MTSIFDITSDIQVSSVSDGEWSDPLTWSSGVVPGESDRVLISSGTTVTISVDSEAKHILVDGVLEMNSFADFDLKVDTIFVTPGGKYVDGTPSQVTFSKHRILFTDSGVIPLDIDPLQVTRGLIAQGEVQIYGDPKDAFVLLSDYAFDTITLERSPAGWEVGDRLIVPGLIRSQSGTRVITPEDEHVVIQAIDGPVVTVDPPLVYNHTPPEPGLEVPVANVTRSILFKSMALESSRAGHFMIMKGGAKLNYFQTDGVGRTSKLQVTTDPELDTDGNVIPETALNTRGRYAVHFHENGYDEQSVVVGVVIENNPGWGIVNHGSDVAVEQCVAYNITGSAFVSEAGNEVGRFKENLAVYCPGRHVWHRSIGGNNKGKGRGLASEGHGFWIQSPGVRVIDNYVFDASQEAYFIHSLARRDPLTREQTLFPVELIPEDISLDPNYVSEEGAQIDKLPLFEFRGNQAAASTVGVGIRWRRQADPTDDPANGNHIQDTTIWNTKYSGVSMGYTGGLMFTNTVILGDVSSPVPLSSREQSNPIHAHDDYGKGFIANINSNNIFLDRLRIEGFTVGVHALRKSDMVIKDAWMRNVIDIRVITAQASQVERKRKLVISGLTSLKLSDSALAGRQQKTLSLTTVIDRPIVGVSGDIDNEFKSIIRPDIVVLNRRRIFYFEQTANTVPFGADVVPDYMLTAPYSNYLDLTNQQLSDLYGFSLGDAIAPESCTIEEGIDGLVSPYWYGG